MASYQWWRDYLNVAGALPVPWVGTPNEVIDMGKLGIELLHDGRVKRVLFDMRMNVSVNGGQDPPAADWWSRLNVFYTVGYTNNAADPPPNPTGGLVGGTLGTGQLSLVQVPSVNELLLVSARYETLGTQEFEAVRGSPPSGDVPYISVGMQTSFTDGLADPLSVIFGSWSCEAYVRVLYLLP